VPVSHDSKSNLEGDDLGHDSSGMPKSQKCVVLKTFFLKIKSVNIRNLTINYVVPDYKVHFGVNFHNFVTTGFAENRLLFLKIWINFTIYSKKGTDLKKLEILQCFILDYTCFLKLLRN